MFLRPKSCPFSKLGFQEEADSAEEAAEMALNWYMCLQNFLIHAR